MADVVSGEKRKMVNWRIYVDKERDDFNAKAKRHLWQFRNKIAFDHIGEWESVAEAVNIGWFDDISEWDDYISSRTALHIVSRIRSLQNHPLMKEFKDRLAAADERFKEVIVPGSPLPRHWLFRKHWWERSVPLRGTRMLVDNVKAMYGLEIEEIKDTHN